MQRKTKGSIPKSVQEKLETEVSYIEEGDYITGCLYSTYRPDGTLYACSYESLDAMGDTLEDAIRVIDGEARP